MRSYEKAYIEIAAPRPDNEGQAAVFVNIGIKTLNKQLLTQSSASSRSSVRVLTKVSGMRSLENPRYSRIP